MIKSRTSLCLIALGACALVSACNSVSEKGRASAGAGALETEASPPGGTDTAAAVATQPAAEPDERFARDKTAYWAKIDREVAVLDRKIEDLVATTKATEGTTKDAYLASLERLQRKRDALVADLRELAYVREADWQDTKTRIESDLAALKAEVRTASATIKGARPASRQ